MATRKHAKRLRSEAVSPRKKPGLVGAYDVERVAAEIDAARKRLKFSVAEAAEASGIKRTVWYKKVDVEGSSFSFDDISRIAAAFRAPQGWPLIPWELAEDFERWRKGR